ncbi:zinc finger protein-like 1 homolog isoform X1 [Asterias rubens]|uniref:zinc finger protein-like 1 homolog isoform X1 n=1 Tax=Asterias rubens TaxID=7604 RepID=UPI00145597E9|nr:zinc finger protein-like 1 homolog isoform X1 [Asterias rubens]XP_033639981.1 zinc finger protein-like 1 homolog isoform X1 [Asterias rubens]
MGLCKCPKRKVTNLFCFEHRVNVCEHCLVANHPKCIVKSYLQWLQDSDYDIRCSLCHSELADGDVVRLLCYDVFHWSCLDEYARQLPPHTAPAGYTCPSCNVGIFPPGNMVSPVAEVLRESLSRVNWARAGLGLSLIDEPHQPSQRLQIDEPEEELYKTPQSSMTEPALKPSTEIDSAVYRPVESTVLQARTTSSSVNIDSKTPLLTPETLSSGQLPAAHKRQGGSKDDEIVDIIQDHDVDKYKRRSALNWFARWFKSRSGKSTTDASTPMRRYAILLILGVIAFFTIVVILTQAGRAASNSDPFLDPMANPNIRVGRKILELGSHLSLDLV